MFSVSEPTLFQSAPLFRVAQWSAGQTLPSACPSKEGLGVAYSPPEIVRRQSAARSGVVVETMQLKRLAPFEYRFRAPCHLLIAAEIAERDDGETLVEGLPRSRQRNFTQKLTFVPAGHDFHGWQKPRALTRTVYLYIDPRGTLADPALRFAEIDFKPRLFFYDRDLWHTALKFKSQLECRGPMLGQYGEALEMLLMHELAHFNGDGGARKAVGRGGLACWQQKRAADYIEEHLADDIPLATLADLVRLSPYHFCRSFRQSFGVPPHRYHAARRIERAKQLLASRELSITAIALMLGFSEVSTFSVAFHRLVGQTPSRYRRSLD
ncbi:helix-turn-helix domain-containing protein [Bradyrhizobium cenepequi]